MNLKRLIFKRFGGIYFLNSIQITNQSFDICVLIFSQRNFKFLVICFDFIDLLFFIEKLLLL
jgi:hypothetical protein